MLPGFHLLAVASTIVAVVFLLVLPSLSFANTCAKKCGHLNIVYPFYVTNESSIEDGNHDCGNYGYGIECDGQTDAFIKLGSHKYKVLDLSIGVIRILPACNSSNLHTFNLTDTPFKISSRNILQLFNCRKQCSNNCSNFVDLKEYGCEKDVSGEPCCESLESLNKKDLQAFTNDFRTLVNYTYQNHCTQFSSWAYSNPQSFSFHVDYGLNLEWSVKGKCDCSHNATCQERNNGYTCHCTPPYVGDGYNIDGFRCQLGAHEESRKSTTLKTLTVFCGLIIIVTILAATIVSAALLCRRNKRGFSLSRGIISDNYRRGDVHIFGPLLSGMEVFTYKQLDKATKGFASTEKLGNGACGAVYAANLDDGRLVAVKKLHHFNTQLGYQQTVNELSVLCTVKHRNLVRLLGCCMESQEPLLVFEYVSNGTLAEHLQGERGEGLDWLTRLTIAAETADALAYLHSVDPPILHRDVKSRNILLDHDFNTKVADFGLSRMGLIPSVDGSHISTIPQGTPGYLDPEYHQNFHLSDKSDVYSFGVVLIEIITALKPVDFSREKKEVNLAALAVAKIGSGCLDDIIDKSLEAHRRPNVKIMVQRVAELAFRCLSYDKDARPSMREVLEELLLIRGTAVSPVVDVPGKDCHWTGAQMFQQSDSGSSLSSSETERFLMSKKSHVFLPVNGLQVVSENKKQLDAVKMVCPTEHKQSNG